jgi:hypothetical protein
MFNILNLPSPFDNAEYLDPVGVCIAKIEAPEVIPCLNFYGSLYGRCTLSYHVCSPKNKEQ